MGFKLVCIDNLMTALEDDVNSDIYRQQSKFVRKLAKMSKRYDIVLTMEKLTRLNDDMIASQIEHKMDQISAGDLSFNAAAAMLNEIKGLVARLDSETAQSYYLYLDILQQRVERHYLINGLNNEDNLNK